MGVVWRNNFTLLPPYGDADIHNWEQRTPKMPQSTRDQKVNTSVQFSITRQVYNNRIT